MGGRFEIESWRGLTAARAGLVRVLETLWGGLLPLANRSLCDDRDSQLGIKWT